MVLVCVSDLSFVLLSRLCPLYLPCLEFASAFICDASLALCKQFFIVVKHRPMSAFFLKRALHVRKLPSYVRLSCDDFAAAHISQDVLFFAHLECRYILCDEHAGIPTLHISIATD